MGKGSIELIGKRSRNCKGERPFPCDKCKGSYKTVTALATHKNKKHGQFWCRECDPPKSFFTEAKLQTHQNVQHTTRQKKLSLSKPRDRKVQLPKEELRSFLLSEKKELFSFISQQTTREFLVELRKDWFYFISQEDEDKVEINQTTWVNVSYNLQISDIGSLNSNSLSHNAHSVLTQLQNSQLLTKFSRYIANDFKEIFCALIIASRLINDAKIQQQIRKMAELKNISQVDRLVQVYSKWKII